MPVSDMSWSTEIELTKGIRKVLISQNGRRLTYADVIEAWMHDQSFISYFASLLKTSPFDAYFWETPPVTINTLSRVFEYVEVDSQLLSCMPVSPLAFEEYFKAVDDNEQIVAFSNLSGDAKLIVPCPNDTLSAYPHIAAFMRKAPDEQIEALWRRVGKEAEKTIRDENVWISTAGTGVAWLHVRLDSFPKYYSYAPYRDGGK
jgi:hypothetical protein